MKCGRCGNMFETRAIVSPERGEEGSNGVGEGEGNGSPAKKWKASHDQTPGSQEQTPGSPEHGKWRDW